MSQTIPPTFFQREDIFTIGHDNPADRHDTLPAGVYLVGASMQGFYLRQLPDFELPKKFYGDVLQKTDKILATFEDRPKTTGVLLSGEKGSGKTLLSKNICMEGVKRGYPTLVVNNSFAGDSFNTFLQSITQPCIVLFDEFEKVYDKDEQQELLTLFDGVFTTKKLLLLTTNDYLGINNHLQNRPGRLYYSLEFKGLDREFIMEYGKDNLKNKAHLSNLGVIASMVNPLSFDILQAIIEECNRYDETPVKALEMLNVRQSTNYSEPFIAELTLTNGKTLIRLDEQGDKHNEIRCTPFRPFTFDYVYKTRKTKSNPDGEQLDTIVVQTDNLVGFNGLKGVYEYKVPEGKVVLSRKPIDTTSAYTRYQDLAYGYDD